MTFDLNPEHKRIKNGSARLEIPPLKYEGGIFFDIKLMKQSNFKNSPYFS